MGIIGLIGNIGNPLPAYGSYLSATLLLSNIIRIVSTALGVYYIGPIVLQSTLHQFNGTTNFLLTFLLLMLLDRGLSGIRRRKRS